MKKVNCRRAMGLMTLALILLIPIEGCEEDENDVRLEGVERTSALAEQEQSASNYPNELIDPDEYRQGADLVRQHYTAISRGSYRRAFDLWEEGAREFNEFTAEAEKISRAVVTYGESGFIAEQDDRITIEVPVTVEITGLGGAVEYRGESFLIREQEDGKWRIVARRSDQQLQ